MTDTRRPNEELLDDLAWLAEGDPATRARYAATLANDADARDLVYEAESLVGTIRDAGADHRAPDDLEARLFARLDGRANPGVGTAAPIPNAPPAAREAPATGGRERGAHFAPEPRPIPVRAEKPASVAPMVALLAVAGFVGFAAIGTGAWWMLNRARSNGAVATATTSGWTGRVEAVFPDPTGASLGAQASFSNRTVGESITAGRTLRTDDRSRARVRMSDGTMLFLDQSTEVVFEADGRRARVNSGVVVADVAHLDRAAGVVFSTPDGRVEVLGTKLSITAATGGSTVRVLRGRVRIANDTGSPVELDAGEEGLLAQGRAPSKSAATSFAEFRDPELDDLADSEDVPGLGELRARRPGERQEQERPLTLAEHTVNVRIVGPVARTEIEETFRNDDDATLEGVYRFPIPDGARIASLSLEVEGRWEQGAFVTKDRARRIFQGVIQHATPHPDVPRPSQEFIWVPGPWRDPALLEWQRGGRFELRIFPIAAHSVRRVRLAYEQTLPVSTHGRRYVYSLPSVRRGESRVGHFAFSARVAGGTDLRVGGYALNETREGEATNLSFASDSFAPKGSITLEYALPNAAAELRSYTYAGPAAVAPGDHAREDEPVRAAQHALAADGRSYVTLAFRPRIDNASQFRATDYTLVVDSSQSMTGERFARARALATSFVGELDRRHRVRVLVCDLGCRPIEDSLSIPGPELASRVDSLLSTVRPMGSSNLLASLTRASAGFGTDASRQRTVIYFGDGMGSVGVTDVGSLELEVRDLASRLGVYVDTVGIGEDADSRALAAVARGGAGHHVPFLPGQSASGAALAVLEATFGASLEHPVLTLPAGVEAIAPAELGTLRPGEELVVNARYSGAVSGEAVLRGKVAGRDYERRFPVVLDATPSSVNGFVPRSWANARIDDLDASEEAGKRAESIALSKAFGVLSRDTSLLVLESEAMVRAYGIDRTEQHVQFRGDALDEDVADAISAEPAVNAVVGALGSAGDGRSGASSGAARASSGPAMAAPAPERRAESEASRDDSADELRARPNAAPATTSSSAPMTMPPRNPGRWMRVVWVRDARIDSGVATSDRDANAVATARVARDASPDSRDRTRDYARALAKAGRLDEALEVTESWLARDPNDVEALVLQSDVVGRLGRPEESARILAGAVDAEPGDVALHERLAIAFERAGRFEDACGHRLALGKLRANDVASQTQASACATRLHLPHVETAIREATAGNARRMNVQLVSGDAENVRGEISVDATGSAGVDVSIVTPRGERASWLGGPRGTTARPSNGGSSSSLAIRTARAGTYAVEITRAAGVTGTVRGELRVRALGQSRTIPYVLDDAHQAVARIVISRHRETVPW